MKKVEEIKLERDTCEKCIALKGKVNGLGQQLYCSQGHAHEPSNIRKVQQIKELKKEIFDVIYQWGRVGVVADENSPAIKERLDKLEETWY